MSETAAKQQCFCSSTRRTTYDVCGIRYIASIKLSLIERGLIVILFVAFFGLALETYDVRKSNILFGRRLAELRHQRSWSLKVLSL